VSIHSAKICSGSKLWLLSFLVSSGFDLFDGAEQLHLRFQNGRRLGVRTLDDRVEYVGRTLKEMRYQHSLLAAIRRAHNCALSLESKTGDSDADVMENRPSRVPRARYDLLAEEIPVACQIMRQS
jgi:hypothetical protein